MLLVSGCQTGAQKQYATITADLATTKNNFEACVRSISDRDQYAPVFTHLPKVGRPSLEQLADQSKISDADKVTFLGMQNELQTCRQMRLEGFGKVYPEAGSVLATTYAEGDNLRVSLIQKRISWGDYVSKINELNIRSQGDLRGAGQHMISELNQEHQAELNRRAAIASAIGAAADQINANYQRQQLINAVSAPHTTSCNRFGNQVNCTTY